MLTNRLVATIAGTVLAAGTLTAALVGLAN
ncbi:hypothetical protein Mycsm_06402 [Mycobacterium sp. JS623]|nr:hypothetical protein Mycsm_06402 [Mycobacterium sp. JS623]